MAAILTPTPVSAGLRPSGTPVRLDLLEGGRSSHPSAATYRRRRLVAVVLAAGLAALALIGLRGGVATVTPRAVAPSAPVIAPRAVATVRPGDTLWSIARRLEPVGDVRVLVDRLVGANGVGVLQPGELVVIPSRSDD